MSVLEGRITLAKISDGAPGPAGPSGQGFYVKANIEDLICYKNDRDITSITSSELVISVYKSQKYLEGEQIDLNVDNCDFGYDAIQGFVSLLEEGYYSFYKEPVWKNDEIDEEETNKRPNSLKIDLNKYITNEIFAKLINTPLKFKYYEDQNGPAAEKAFSFRWGTTADLASFDVTAFAITQAIGHNVMSFTQEGLQIYNTGLTIYGNETINYIQTSDKFPQDKKKYYIKNNNNVYSEFIGESFDANEVYFEQIITQPKNLYADKEGNLHISGCLEAATGSFSGEVSATSGRIGGLELGENELRSGMYVNAEWDDREPRYKQEENGEYVKLTEKPNDDKNVNIYKKALVISGNDGKIYANNIVLGDGAIIENFIALGTEENEKAFLQNPDKYDKVFLKSGDISFSSNGTAKFGSISLEKNGQDMEIKGTNWSILPDRASFKNISVSGDIETAVFKTGTVQAGGSTMLFMPSYSILDWYEDKIENKTVSYIVIDGKYSMKSKEATGSTTPESIWLVFDNGYSENTIVNASFDENNKQTTITLGEAISNKPIGMIIIGTDNSLVMGINGSNTNALDGLILAGGLTLTSVSQGEKSKPNLFLGDLTSVGLSGYGLYSDNVHLNGSLVTGNGAYYAGINTTDPWYIGKKEEKNRAIFWAGVTKNENSGEYNYSDSPFYVTQGGHVYAKDIELAEAVIAGGSITGTEIHTAKIYGEGSANNSDVPGLSIYDTNNGISFRTIKEQDGEEIEVETFSIGLSGLKVKNSEFVLIKNDEVVFTGAQFKTDNIENYLSMGKIDNIPALYHKEGTSSCGFYFEKTSTNFRIEENVKLKLASGGIELDGSVVFSQYQKGKLTYQAAEKGYDLFIE